MSVVYLVKLSNVVKFKGYGTSYICVVLCVLIDFFRVCNGNCVSLIFMISVTYVLLVVIDNFLCVFSIYYVRWIILKETW